MGWRDYLIAEWEFNENDASFIFADNKSALYPITARGGYPTSDFSVAGKFNKAFLPNRAGYPAGDPSLCTNCCTYWQPVNS